MIQQFFSKYLPKKSENVYLKVTCTQMIIDFIYNNQKPSSNSNIHHQVKRLKNKGIQ